MKTDLKEVKNAVFPLNGFSISTFVVGGPNNIVKDTPVVIKIPGFTTPNDNYLFHVGETTFDFKLTRNGNTISGVASNISRTFTDSRIYQITLEYEYVNYGVTRTDSITYNVHYNSFSSISFWCEEGDTWDTIKFQFKKAKFKIILENIL